MATDIKNRKGLRVAIAVLWLAALGSSFFLWVVLEAGGTRQADAESSPSIELPGSYYRHVFSLGEGRGSVVAEYGGESGLLSLRHTPPDGSVRASHWSGDVGFALSGVSALPGEPLTLLLRGRGELVDGKRAQVHALLPVDLPLVEPEVVSARDHKLSSRSGCRHRKSASLSSEFLAASQQIGAETVQGLPPDHTESVEVTSVRELLVHRASEVGSGESQVAMASRIVVRGRVVAPSGNCKVAIEVGQVGRENASFAVALSVDGGDLFEPQFVTKAVEAFPPGFAGASDDDEARQVYHVLVSIPEDSSEFELRVNHDFVIQPKGRVWSWYYCSQDFGRQASIAGGYEAIILWNRPIARGDAVKTVPPTDGVFSVEWIDDPREWLYQESVAPEVAEGIVAGFRASVGASHPAATVHYIPVLEARGR